MKFLLAVLLLAAIAYILAQMERSERSIPK